MFRSASNQPLSVSVGDYVKAIWEIAGNESVSTSEVSAQLSVSPASVTSMMKRLQEMGLVEYERYRGASLTGLGEAEALRIVRRHRLIETFLIEHLGYSWENVHEEAERLEHAVSDEFTGRLAKMLGDPDRDPHGDLIPDADGTIAVESSLSLADVEAGQRVRILRVNDESERLVYLGERGLIPGSEITVAEVRDLDGVVTVENDAGDAHSLGSPLAASIFVCPA